MVGTHPQTPAERIHNVRGCARTPPQAFAAHFVQLAVSDVVFAPRDASDDRSHSVHYRDYRGRVGGSRRTSQPDGLGCRHADVGALVRFEGDLSQRRYQLTGLATPLFVRTHQTG